MLKPNMTVEDIKIEQQYKKYNKTSALSNLRCLIRVLRDPIWREQETIKALQELDSYSGEGQGSTLRKVHEVKDFGNEQSVRPCGACLVRA